MKKLLFLLSVLTLILVPRTTFAADVTERVTINSNPSSLTYLVTRPGTQGQWLIRVTADCDKLATNDKAELVIRGALNGNMDYLKTSDLHRCAIKQADPINASYDVLFVYSSNTIAILRDETNQKYRVYYGSTCQAIQGFKDSKVYGMRQSKGLTKSDRIFIPNQRGSCFFQTVIPLKEPVKPAPAPKTTPKDIQKPTTVTNVKASPARTQAFVYWDKAEDNVKVAYYWVRTGKYNQDPKYIPTTFKSTDIKAYTSSATIKNLDTDTLYYFYVLAVDSSGNVSSFWSLPGTAQTRSSLSDPFPAQFVPGSRN